MCPGEIRSLVLAGVEFNDNPIDDTEYGYIYIYICMAVSPNPFGKGRSCLAPNSYPHVAWEVVDWGGASWKKR